MTEHANKIPNFLVIGATKCGTESMHEYLSRHPDVYIHPKKELRFFTNEKKWSMGVGWYEKQFNSVEKEKVVGESSNSYSRFEIYGGVPEKIYKLFPDMKFIYLIRNPFERIKSHYKHRVIMGREWRKPKKAINKDLSYIATSCYGRQLKKYLEHFQLDQFLVLRLEKLISEPTTELRKLSGFLQIQYIESLEFPEVNVTTKRHLSPTYFRWLNRYKRLRPHTKKISKFIMKLQKQNLQISGDNIKFNLDKNMHDDLSAIFKKDTELLSKIIDESFDDWNLDLKQET